MKQMNISISKVSPGDPTIPISAYGIYVFDDRAPAEIQHIGIVAHIAVMMSNEHHWEGLQTFCQGSLDGPSRRDCNTGLARRSLPQI
jgi:hypothetical protein